MTPTRQTQPYRRGARSLSPVLLTILRGRTLYRQHPLDALRMSQRQARRISR